MSRIDGAAHVAVDEFSMGAYRFKQRLEFGMHEIFAQLGDGSVNLSVEAFILNGLTDT